MLLLRPVWQKWVVGRPDRAGMASAVAGLEYSQEDFGHSCSRPASVLYSIDQHSRHPTALGYFGLVDANNATTLLMECLECFSMELYPN